MTSGAEASQVASLLRDLPGWSFDSNTNTINNIEGCNGLLVARVRLPTGVTLTEEQMRLARLPAQSVQEEQEDIVASVSEISRQCGPALS